jgi:flagellar export protein FliJ
MAFQFVLAPLLRLRRSIERQRTLQLQEANLRVARARQALADLERFMLEAVQSDAAGLAAGRTAAELQFAILLREKMQHYREQLRSSLSELELARQKALAAYHQAYREREVLETLRARQRSVYQQEQSRRQQQELDAAHLLQRWHRRD